MPLLVRTRARDESGFAMAVVAVLVVLCATVSLVVASSTIFGTRQTTVDLSRVQALSAAEGGRDAALADMRTGLKADPNYCPNTGATGFPYASVLPTSSYRARVVWSSETDPTKLPSTPPSSTCPASGAVVGYFGIYSEGTAADATTAKSVLAWYPFTRTVTVTDPGTPPGPTLTTADGAILEGGSSSMNIPNVTVKGDVVLGASSFNCNGTTLIDGDLVLPHGSVDMSNACRVTGDVVASGDIFVHNLTNQIGGDLVSTGGTIRVEGAQIGGSVKADGGVQLNNSVQVGGDVIARGDGSIECKGTGATGSAFTGSSSSSKTIGGSVKIGGAFCQADLTTVTGSIVATGTGATSIGGVGPVKASSIQLAGTCSPCAGTPTPKTGVKGLAAVDFTDPASAGYATWLEIPWTGSTPWTKAGWTVTTAGSSNCDYQSNAALVTAINNLTQPTVVDARGCANGLNFYGVVFKLKTDVTFIAKAFASAQNVNVKVAGSGSRTFNLIVPDANSADNQPTCPAGSPASTIYGTVLDPGVSGMAYSPCTLAIGTVTWKGQLIAGYPDPAGGNNSITYTPIGVPGASASGGGTVSIAAPGPVVPPTYSTTAVLSASTTQQTEP